jgi:hypothetical protein
VLLARYEGTIDKGVGDGDYKEDHNSPTGIAALSTTKTD